MATKQRIIRLRRHETSFPLYENLVKSIEEDRPLPHPKVWTQVSKLDPENATIIYLLIIHYARLHGNEEEIPYARKIPEGGRGVIYDVESLPKELQLILAEAINQMTNSA